MPVPLDSTIIHKYINSNTKYYYFGADDEGK
jgi:hypothetical protein